MNVAVSKTMTVRAAVNPLRNRKRIPIRFPSTHPKFQALIKAAEWRVPHESLQLS